MPKLVKLVPEVNSKFALQSSWEANVGGSNGLADLQEFHNIDLQDLVKGHITDFLTGQTFMAKSKLSSTEILKIANAARAAKYLESYVLWCKAALEAAKQEGKDKKYISQIKKMIKLGKEVHDECFIKTNFTHGPIGDCRFIRSKPFTSTVLTERAEAIYAHEHEIFNARFDSLIDSDSKEFPANGLTHRMDLFLRRRTQDLCRGKVSLIQCIHSIKMMIDEPIFYSFSVSKTSCA